MDWLFEECCRLCKSKIFPCNFSGLNMALTFPYSTTKNRTETDRIDNSGVVCDKV
uniref:Uncharacterized protein n=1 Tax=Octopus bimaculoides TaxID=37653 RepID=A0A0L8H4Q0_OCTBM